MPARRASRLSALARPLACSLALAVASPSLALAKKPHHSSEHASGEAKPDIKAESAVIVDYDTGRELYSRNPDEVRRIASVGKLFLALTVRAKKLPLEGKTTITEDDKKVASGGARSRLQVGKTFTNHDLLRAMLIASDNRACSALGRAAGMTPDELVTAINDEAKRLGLTHTRFVDPVGLKPNVSTAREIAIVLKAALADPVLADILATPHVVVKSVDGKNPITVEYNSTDLALRDSGRKFPVLGGKTGYTDEAKYCLAIAAKPAEHLVGMVFLGEDGKLTRFGDFHRTVEWILSGVPDKLAARAVGAAVEPPPAAVTPRMAR